LRPWPFRLAEAFALLGLGLSATLVRETREHMRAEAGRAAAAPSLPFGQVVALATWRDRSLSAASQAGLVNNLNDGVAWGLLPLWYAAAGLGLERVALPAAIAPAGCSRGSWRTASASRWRSWGWRCSRPPRACWWRCAWSSDARSSGKEGEHRREPRVPRGAREAESWPARTRREPWRARSIVP